MSYVVEKSKPELASGERVIHTTPASFRQPQATGEIIIPK